VDLPLDHIPTLQVLFIVILEKVGTATSSVAHTVKGRYLCFGLLATCHSESSSRALLKLNLNFVQEFPPECDLLPPKVPGFFVGRYGRELWQLLQEVKAQLRTDLAGGWLTKSHVNDLADEPPQRKWIAEIDGNDLVPDPLIVLRGDLVEMTLDLLLPLCLLGVIALHAAQDKIFCLFVEHSHLPRQW
jgi:hypothetical protein